jgi:hypothetical protein
MIPELNLLGSRNFTLCEATSSLIHVTDPPTAMSIFRGSNFPSAMWMVAAIAGGFSPDDAVESVPQDVAARAITANNVTAKNRCTRVRFIDAPT